MISGYLIGDKALIAKLSAMPSQIKADLDNTVRRLTEHVKGTVQRDWLRGPRPQRLAVKTGRLITSISTRYEFTANTSYGYVGTNVPYGIMWERTGRPAQTIVPVKAKALRFEVGGEILFRKKVTIPGLPPRPFLKPGLVQDRTYIVGEIRASLHRTAVEALK